MKKCTTVLLLLLMLSLIVPAPAAENTEEMAIGKAQSLLTEVYGYTLEEAQAFTYEVTEDAQTQSVNFYNDPNWVYQAVIRKDDQSFTSATTPFSTEKTPKAPENSVRDVLRAIEDNGWFESWNIDSKTALHEKIEWCGDIAMTTSMQRGLSADDYTAAQALQDFFLSCYGDEMLWSQPLQEWRDAMFDAFGLVLGSRKITMPQGIVNRVAGVAAICEFVGDVPNALWQLFSHPMLEGWDCLAGAYYIEDPVIYADRPYGYGLAAFQQGEERLLVMLYLDDSAETFQVVPVSKTALLPGRDLYITCDSIKAEFSIVYPIEGMAQESFQCRFRRMTATPELRLMCEMEQYSYENLTGDSSLIADVIFTGLKSNVYRVTTRQNGVTKKAQFQAIMPGWMEYLDAAAFPQTMEAWETAEQEIFSVPEGYGISSNVHLRADTSSHSKDLGTYRMGTLVQVLDTLPGSAFPWYHVRIGNVEGYMSSNYVTYGDAYVNGLQYPIPGVAKILGSTALKERPSGFAKSIADLPESAIVRVLAETGNWLHISIPNSPDDWMMQPDEVCGYVKRNAVVEAPSILQLEWMMPQK